MYYMKKLHLLLFLLVASLPIIVGIYDTLNGQVYGIDSWYWLKVTGQPVWFFNLWPLALYVLITVLFYRANGSLDNRFLLLIIFLSNIFVVRFIEVEFDDFLMYAMLFSIVAVNPKKLIWLTIPVIILYALMHGWFFNIPNFNFLSLNLGLNAEESPNIWLDLLLFLPTIYLFFLNNKWKYLSVLLIFLAVFAIPKMTNPLPLFLLPAYLAMASDEKIKFPSFLIIGFAIIAVIMITSEAFREVHANLDAFIKYCNTEQMICYNFNQTYYDFGHYFAYLGYRSYSHGYGACTCIGIQCFNQTVGQPGWC
jgi:hypothetical protein